GDGRARRRRAGDPHPPRPRGRPAHRSRTPGRARDRVRRPRVPPRAHPGGRDVTELQTEVGVTDRDHAYGDDRRRQGVIGRYAERLPLTAATPRITLNEGS